jgi:hypothetical protein
MLPNVDPIFRHPSLKMDEKCRRRHRLRDQESNQTENLIKTVKNDRGQKGRHKFATTIVSSIVRHPFDLGVMR